MAEKVTFRVPGFGFRVSGSGFRKSGSLVLGQRPRLGRVPSVEVVDGVWRINEVLSRLPGVLLWGIGIAEPFDAVVKAFGSATKGRVDNGFDLVFV